MPNTRYTCGIMYGEIFPKEIVLSQLHYYKNRKMTSFNILELQIINYNGFNVIGLKINRQTLNIPNSYISDNI